MSRLAVTFEQLRGRPPTKDERLRLFHIRDALSLRDDDALWAFFITFDEYRSAAADVPRLIREAGAEAVAHADNAAKAQVEVVIAGAQAEAIRTMSAAVMRTAKVVSIGQVLMHSALLVSVVAIGIGVFGVFVQRTAYDQGYAAATEVAELNDAATAWAHTEQGKRAYAYALDGQLDRWLYCTHPGFRIEGGLCYPDSLDNGARLGWRIHPEAPRKKRTKRG